MMSAVRSRASGSSVGKNSTVRSQSISSCQYGSKTSLRFVLKIDNLPVSGFPCQNSRYKDGATWALAFSPVPYRALQSDRCLVITT